MPVQVLRESGSIRVAVSEELAGKWIAVWIE
jgi:hypothetical protein